MLPTPTLTGLRHRTIRATRSRGITLIEMVIAIVIVGIFATVAVIYGLHMVAQAQVAATEQTMSSLVTALDSYDADHGSFPASGTVSATLFGGAGNQYYNGNGLDAQGNAITYTLESGTPTFELTSGTTWTTGLLDNLPLGSDDSDTTTKAPNTTCTTLIVNSDIGAYCTAGSGGGGGGS